MRDVAAKADPIVDNRHPAINIGSALIHCDIWKCVVLKVERFWCINCVPKAIDEAQAYEALVTVNDAVLGSGAQNRNGSAAAAASAIHS